MTLPSYPAPDGFGPPGMETTVDAGPAAGPFTNLTPHARGGLGEVYRATDPELHRTVAVKYLQDRHAANPESRRRFLLEAEVTARLEHPGVVPVYGLYAGGPRPAYAMRFIEGQTLAEAIAAYHAGPPDAVVFRRLLQAFLQICQTVAYAHSRGVIHRDLKPANVMLGKFGETLVVDWGLAKVVGRAEAVRAAGTGETLLVSAGVDSGPGETAMGSAIGTPAYMSPEQAAGRWDVVAQLSDVYSLGAVLYTVLTGRPPLEKGNWPEMQQKIQRGDFPRPRQAKPDVPRPLEAVCLKAMALEPPGRYASAEALAADVEHWLADEPVAAYREPLLPRTRRWAKRHRTAVGSAAALLVAAVVGLSIGTILLQQARVDTERQRQAAVAAQAKSEALNRFLIDDLLKQADPVNNPVGDKLTVRQLLDMAGDRLGGQTNLSDQPEVEADLRAVIGHAYEYLDVYDKAEPHYRRAWELRSRLLGPEHPDTLAIRNRLVCAVLQLGQLPNAEAAGVDALETCTRVLGPDHPETAEAANNLGELRTNQGRFPEAIALRRRASRIATTRNGPDDNKALEYDNDLAATLVTAGEPDEALVLLKSVADRRRKASPDHPELATTLANLGANLVALGRFAEAEPVLREAITRQIKSRGAESPGNLSARNLLCYALEGQGQWAEAEKEYLDVLAKRRMITGPESRDTQRTLGFLARLHAKQQQWPDAAKYLATLLLAQKPDPKRNPESLAIDLETALTGTAAPPAGEPLLRECSEAVKMALWNKDWFRSEVASRYGDCLRRQGKYAEAEPILVTAANDVAKAVGVPAWGAAAARKRVADLYEAWDKPAEAAKWR